MRPAAWAEAYLRTKWHLDPSSRLGTIDMGRLTPPLSLRPSPRPSLFVSCTTLALLFVSATDAASSDDKNITRRVQPDFRVILFQK